MARSISAVRLYEELEDRINAQPEVTTDTSLGDFMEALVIANFQEQREAQKRAATRKTTKKGDQ